MVLLQASNSGGAIVQMLIFGGIFLVFYLFFIRPQAKKQKDQTNFVKAIEKGDEVVTTSGIVGKINKIEGEIIHLQIDQKTFIRVLKSAISKELTDSMHNQK
jgi:preprotein translocase subunit YajC